MGKRKECRRELRDFLLMIDQDIAGLPTAPIDTARIAAMLLRQTAERRCRSCVACSKCGMAEEAFTRLPRLPL